MIHALALAATHRRNLLPPFLAGLLILLISTGLWAALPPVAQAQEAEGDCRQILEDLLREPDWEERLRSPVFSNPEEEAVYRDRYAQAHACLETKGENLTEEETLLLRLTEYFLIFSSGYGDTGHTSTLQRIDPGESQDLALVRIRDQAGLPPPPGYFFVRLYRTPSEMPSLLRAAFDRDEVAGVTLLDRYIAVLVVDDQGWENTGRLDNETLDVLSHELIHAYVNSTLGSEAVHRLPVWYREGLAIYFSGGGKSYTYMGPGWTFRRVPTQEYQVYDEAFRYLERSLNREELLERSRLSIQEMDPSLLYHDLGFLDDEGFLTAVQEWSRARERRETVLVCLAIPLSIGGLLLFMAWMEPEYTCRYCQRGGRRREFSSGVCPYCGTPVVLE